MKNSSKQHSIIDSMIRTWGSLSIGTRGQFKMGTRGSVCSGISTLTDNPRLLKVLAFYKNYRSEIADHSSDLYRLKQEFETSKAMMPETETQL